MIRKYLPEIMTVIVLGFFIGLMFSFYQLERAKVRVYCLSRLDKVHCKDILK